MVAAARIAGAAPDGQTSPMADGILWQGACELLEESYTRVGTLYVLEDAVVFLEGGRVPRGGFGGAGVLLVLAGILGFLFAITGPSGGEPLTTGALVARSALGLLGLGCLGLAGGVWRAHRARNEQMLETLAEPIVIPSRAALQNLQDTAPGAFELQLSDLRAVESEGPRGVTLRSRLDDVYRMRVRPDRDGFAAAVRPRLGVDEDPA